MRVIKAIETRYAGCRFRSRAEARWAVFFDAVEEPWEYEKEGYELPSGKYLPDFWLPRPQLWVEVKGADATGEEEQLAMELADTTDCPVAILSGQPGTHRLRVFAGDTTDSTGGCGWHDGLFLAVSDSFHGGFLCLGTNDTKRDFWTPNLQPTRAIIPYHDCIGFGCSRVVTEALIASRSARFEHGERG
jgi:hypothetical protein